MPEISRAQLVAYAALAILVVALGVRYMQRQQPPSVPAAGGAAAAAGGRPDGSSAVRIAPPPAQTTLVHIAGAVRHPGVYRVPAGARVQDAVRRAGGVRRGGDANAINLAAKVVDGQQVVVPSRGGAAAGGSVPAADGAAPAGAASPGPPISLNNATAEQLDTLDGVGPATAAKIIAWRTQHGGFRSIADLGQVPGIGPKKLAAIKDRVQP